MTEPAGPDEAEVTERLLANVREKHHALETLAHDRAAYGPEDVLIAPSLERVGRLERILGDVAGAKGRFEKAVEIDEASMGAGHPATVRSRDELDSINRELEAEGDSAAAE